MRSLELMERLRAAGFERTEAHPFSGGIVTAYLGTAA